MTIPADAPDQKRWWYPLTQPQSEGPSSIRSGADLNVLEPHEVKSGAVIEVAKATDAEEGPPEPVPEEERSFILSKKGEYLLAIVPPGATVKEVAAALPVAQAEIQAAIATTCEQVSSATHEAEDSGLLEHIAFCSQG